MADSPEHILKRLMATAIQSCHPQAVMRGLSIPGISGRTVVVAAGKAAAAMALAYEKEGYPFDSGIAVGPRGTSVELPAWQCIEANHPVPDSGSIAASDALLDAAHALGQDDQLIVLLSGGASSLLAAPVGGISLTQKQTLTEELLRSGAPISTINTLRKHISRIKGGGLAKAASPAPCHTFAISDVVGNDPAAIASGPTVADPTTVAQAQEVLRTLPAHVQSAVMPHLVETAKPSDPLFGMCSYQLIATPERLLNTAKQLAPAQGWQVMDLGATVEGEAAEVARQHAALLSNISPHGTPVLILSGGELTVTLSTGNGIGGPNHEYALSLAIALQRRKNTYALSVDTDGIDGNTGASGAFVTPSTLAQAHSSGLDPKALLEDHNAGHFFAKIGAQLTLGPTGTNVNDLRAILVMGEK